MKILSGETQNVTTDLWQPLDEAVSPLKEMVTGKDSGTRSAVIARIDKFLRDRYSQISKKINTARRLNDEEIALLISKEIVRSYHFLSPRPDYLRSKDSFPLTGINYKALSSLRNNSHNKILIIWLKLIGDTVSLIPYFYLLREVYPRAEFYCLSWRSAAADEIIAEHPVIKKVFVLDEEKPLRIIDKSIAIATLKLAHYILGFITQLRKYDFDMVINLDRTYVGFLLSYVLGRNSVLGWSITDTNKLYFNGNFWHFVLFDKKVIRGLHFTEHLLRTIGRGRFNINTNINIDTQWENRVLARYGIIKGAQYIGFVPGARIPTRMWDKQNFVKLADRLLSHKPDVQIIILGDSKTSNVANFIEKNTKAKVINLCGKTSIKELKALLRQCELIVTNDTGPKHIAVSQGIPVVEMSGAGNRVHLLGPYGPNNITLEADLPCIGCNQLSCNKGGECMKLITPEAVYRAILIQRRLLEHSFDGVDAPSKIRNCIHDLLKHPCFEQINVYYSGDTMPDEYFCYIPLKVDINVEKQAAQVLDCCYLRLWQTKDNYLTTGKVGLVKLNIQRLVRPLVLEQIDIQELTECISRYISELDKFMEEFRQVYERMRRNKCNINEGTNGLIDRAPGWMKVILSINCVNIMAIKGMSGYRNMKFEGREIGQRINKTLSDTFLDVRILKHYLEESIELLRGL